MRDGIIDNRLMMTGADGDIYLGPYVTLAGVTAVIR